jgi:hypothetical protein
MCNYRENSLCTDKKENPVFLIYKEIQNGAVAMSYMTKASSYVVKYLLISSLGSPSSYTTLQLLHSEFSYTYMWKILFSFFISVAKAPAVLLERPAIGSGGR